MKNMNIVKKKKILEKLNKGKITKKKAYDLLYGSEIEKIKATPARFVKMKIDIIDHQSVSKFINTIFYFPIPIGLALKIGERSLVKGIKNNYGKKNSGNEILSKELISAIRSYGGGTKIYVEAEEVNIKIKII